MTKYRLDKNKSVAQKMFSLFFLVFLPAVIRGFTKSVILTAFVLLTLPKYIPSNDIFMWAVLALALFGIWKLLDHLDKVIEDFLNYVKMKQK